MKRKNLLVIDAIINFILGILLLLVIPFPKTLPEFLGLPIVHHPFYPSIFGGVLIGIGFALLLEASRMKHSRYSGLGLGGAIAINLSGGFVLLIWLSFGKLSLPLRGYISLWLLSLLLIGISSVELFTTRRNDI